MSLIETVTSTPKPIKPELGMGVTMVTGLGGLYRPMTIIAIRRNGREIDVQFDKVIHITTGGWTDNGEKEFEPDPNGAVHTVTLRKDGTWIAKGTEMVWYATRYRLGFRRDWTDYRK